MCRKVLLTGENGEIDIWGDGIQTRTFMYIEDCLDGILRIMRGDYPHPLNLGTDYMISINDLARLAMSFESKNLTLNHIPGPLGVRGRSSDNTLIKKVLGWAPSIPLEQGLKENYFWIKSEIEKARAQGETVETRSYLPDSDSDD